MNVVNQSVCRLVRLSLPPLSRNSHSRGPGVARAVFAQRTALGEHLPACQAFPYDGVDVSASHYLCRSSLSLSDPYSWTPGSLLSLLRWETSSRLPLVRSRSSRSACVSTSLPTPALIAGAVVATAVSLGATFFFKSGFDAQQEIAERDVRAEPSVQTEVRLVH